jgi:hypothetical protein
MDILCFLSIIAGELIIEVLSDYIKKIAKFRESIIV